MGTGNIIIHTLGPTGTNCELAAKHWLSISNRLDGVINLHTTLEEAAEKACQECDLDSYLLSCVVYPDLHKIVFNNLHCLSLVDCFIMPTYDMVYALRPGISNPKIAISHPAPVLLIPKDVPQTEFTTSNSMAAVICAQGGADACITTLPAAAKYGLQVIINYGPIPMGYCLHKRITKKELIF